MTIQYKFARNLFGGVVLALVLLHVQSVYAEPVSEKQVLEIAEFWYPAEVNLYEKKGWKWKGNENKSDLLASAQVSCIRYLTEPNSITNKVIGNESVLAYIIEFFPRGYAVVAADDSVSPLLEYSVNSDFYWDDTVGPANALSDEKSLILEQASTVWLVSPTATSVV